MTELSRKIKEAIDSKVENNIYKYCEKHYLKEIKEIFSLVLEGSEKGMLTVVYQIGKEEMAKRLCFYFSQFHVKVRVNLCNDLVFNFEDMNK